MLILKVAVALLSMGLFAFSANAQLIYYPPGHSHDPQRRIIYDANGIDVIDTNNDTGLWTKGYTPLRPGQPTAPLSGSSFAGVLHSSNLESDGMCTTVHTWNFISGNTFYVQKAESSVLVPFTLNEEVTMKIDYSGFWNLINHTHSQQLYAPQIFRIKGGLTANGDTEIEFSGAGSAYLTLAAGDYRMSTGINNSLTCSSSPCLNEVAGSFRFDVQVLNDAAVPGSSVNKPYLASLVVLNEDIDQQFVDVNGALVYRADSQLVTFEQVQSGWFQLEVQNSNLIEPQNGVIIHTLELPDNRAGGFMVAVGDIELGRFEGGDVLVFDDFSAELGSSLLTGVNQYTGVAAVTISYQTSAGESLLGSCGFADRMAVRLGFDQDMVDLNSTSFFQPDPIFSGRFE